MDTSKKIASTLIRDRGQSSDVRQRRRGAYARLTKEGPQPLEGFAWKGKVAAGVNLIRSK